jgi:hypothetical protein
MLTDGRVFKMSYDYKIRLLLSKSCAYKAGYERAVVCGDTAAAKKWKKGYQSIKEEIYLLKKKAQII